MITRDMPFPRATDQGAWSRLAPGAVHEIRAAGEAMAIVSPCGEPSCAPSSDWPRPAVAYPPLTASQHMAFMREGNRVVFETPYFERRNRLIVACLNVCLDAGGPFLDAVIDGLFCICEESSWCVSAHADSLLPDAASPIIDLFAAQTAATISWVCYLLEPLLPAEVIRRAQSEVQRRLFTPFFGRDDFWWMGLTRKDLNNWTPWILSNTLACLRVWGLDGEKRALEILERWLLCIPMDGGLDEGVAYWNMAGASLLDCLDHLGIDRYSEPKIRNLAAYPLNMHIAGPYFINFADCDAKPMLDGERVYRFGELAQNEALRVLGASLCERHPGVLPQDTPEFYRVLCRLFRPVQSEPMPLQAPRRITLPDLQIWVRETKGLYFAIKGGHNAESHNHNDVGSFLLYIDGEPALVDAGNMVYTGKTFSGQRYSLFNTSSANHSVPMIGAYEQAAGGDHMARDVQLGADHARMDIAPAYPKEAGLLRCLRTAAMEDGAFTLADEITLGSALPVTWVFLLRQRPELTPGAVRLKKLLLTYSGRLEAAASEYPVTDARMAKSFPGSLWRLTLTSEPATHHQAFFRMERGSS